MAGPVAGAAAVTRLFLRIVLAGQEWKVKGTELLPVQFPFDSLLTVQVWTDDLCI